MYERLSRYRAAICAGLVLAVLGTSIAFAATSPGFRIVNTHKLPPLSALGPRPQRCTASSETACIERGSYGSVQFSPHVLRNNGILTATVAATGCHACAAVWPATGPEVADAPFRYLKVLKGCGPLRCRWRAARNAPLVAFTVVALDISPHPPVNGPSVVSDYVGIRSSFAFKYVP